MRFPPPLFGSPLLGSVIPSRPPASVLSVPGVTPQLALKQADGVNPAALAEREREPPGGASERRSLGSGSGLSALLPTLARLLSPWWVGPSLGPALIAGGFRSVEQPIPSSVFKVLSGFPLTSTPSAWHPSSWLRSFRVSLPPSSGAGSDRLPGRGAWGLPSLARPLYHGYTHKSNPFALVDGAIFT